MFVVNLNYIAPLEQIDANMGDHMKFLRKYYKLNAFIASGRKVPRTGGIILVLAKSKEEVEKIINEDPFINRKLAEYSIIEFNASQVHPSLKELIG
ncbi:MAG TPA: YciI family protein [Cyclobacteriaceae bacterium]|nr:YciI family protein [Cyclobacteriaceae bacterium]